MLTSLVALAQDFNFPLETIAPFVASFANKTGIPVGGVDLIWKDNPDVGVEPYTLEVSPTSDINPPSPPDWTEGYAEFKHTKVGTREEHYFLSDLCARAFGAHTWASAQH